MVDYSKKAEPYLPIVQQASQQYGVPEDLLLALLAQESGFNPAAKSPAGALGIAQFMPGTAQDYGIDPLQPSQAIPAAAKYLRKGLDKYQDPNLALAAYNSGFGNVDKHGGIPPFPETQAYVPAVNALRQQFSSMTQPQQQFSSVSEEQPQYTLDPAAFLSKQPQHFSSGMRTLLSVLGTIGALGGNAANVVSSIKGNGPVGNAGIASGTGLLEILAKQSEEQDKYNQLSSIVNNTNLPANVRAAYALGDKKGAVDLLDPMSQKINNLKVKNLEQDIYNSSPAGMAAKNKTALELYRDKAQIDAESEAQNPDPFKQTAKVVTLRDKNLKNDNIKQLVEVSNRTTQINEAWESYKSGDKTNANAFDQTLINTFNKINDPSSVVRESEYARTAQGLSWANRIKGLGQKIKNGGAGLTDQDREDLVQFANVLLDARVRDNKTYINSIGDIAKKLGVSPDELLPLPEAAKGSIAEQQLLSSISGINQSVGVKPNLMGAEEKKLLEKYKGRYVK